MVTFIFAIASLLILTPVMLLLPVGYSKKWKLGLIAAAFLLADVGLLANMQLPLYQTILILLLLSTLVSMLLGNRIQQLTPPHVDSGLNKVNNIFLEKEPLHNNEKNNVPFHDFSSALKETAASINNIEEDLDEELESEPILNEEDLVIMDYQADISKINKPVKAENQLDIDDDIDFLENRVIDFGTDELKKTLEKKESVFENTYMSEIEKLIEADADEAFIKELHEHDDIVPQVEMEELEEISVSNFAVSLKGDELEPENDVIEIEEIVIQK